MSGICQPTPEVLEAFKKFKGARNLSNAALIMKVDMKECKIIIDQELNDVTPESLQDELPDAVPRYIVYIYKHMHRDGRVAYPLCFIYYSPPQLKPEIAMMYSSSLQPLYSKLQVQKVFEIQTPSDLTEDWLKQKLEFFQ